MDIIKKKWKNLTFQKRLKDLWGDYLEVSHLKDDVQTLKKFKNFLDQANETVQYYVAINEGNEKLEEILGDTGKVLDNILEYLNQFQEIKNKPERSDSVQLLQDIFEQCLQLAEFILKDPKYRRSVESTHNLLGEFLNLMEKAQKNESKVIIIKLLVLFSENINQRIEFFEQQGFHRLLQIIMTRDPKLSRVISTALLHFLSLEDISQVDFEIENSTSEEDKQFLPIKTKISKIVLDFRKFAFVELQKVFLHKNSENSSKELLELPSEQTVEDLSLQSALNERVCYEKIFQTDLAIYLDIGSEHDSVNDSPMIIQQNEEVNGQFQMLQGGFKAILEMLLKATNEVQVELMSTIKKILISDSRHKIEFKKINGYEFLNTLFTQKEKEHQELLNQLFSFLQVLITDDTMYVKDYDAFTLLLELITFSNTEQVILCGYQSLNFLLLSNWKNTIIAQRLKISYYLILLQMRYFYDSDGINDFLNRLPNDFIKCGLQSCVRQRQFNQINCGLLAPQLQTILLSMSQLVGIYSLESETIFSTLAVNQLMRNDLDDKSYYLKQLYNILNLKFERPWSSINSFDHLTETLFKNLSTIFCQSFSKFKELNTQVNIQDCLFNFIDIVQLINKFLLLLPNTSIEQIPQTNPHFIQNLVSQNRWEQVRTMFDLPVKMLTENLKGLLEAFDFESSDKSDLVNSVLQYRLNLILLNSLCLLMRNYEAFYSKVNNNDGPSVIAYLIQSQYDLYQQLKQQNDQLESPVLEIARNLLHVIDAKHLKYLSVLMNFLSKNELSDSCSTIFESVLRLLEQPEIMKLVKVATPSEQSTLQNIALRVLILLPRCTNHLNLYASLLQVLELLIPNMGSDEIDAMLDLIFASDTIKRIQQKDLGYSTSLCDVLSLLSIHSMIGSGQGVILDRMLTQGEYLTNVLGLLEYNNLQVKSQGVKTAITYYLLNNRSKKIQNFSNKTKFMQLMQKLLSANDIEFNNQFCNMLYKLVFWNLDNYHIQFPENSSQVSSTMNRSEFAEIIIKSQRIHLEQLTLIQKIQNTDMLELFFLSLLKNSEANYCTEVLKVFESILDPTNINILLDVPNFLSWFTDKHDSTICRRIITKVVIFDFAKPPKQSRVVELLRRSCCQDSQLVENIIKDFLQSLIESPILKGDQSNMLKNFQNLLSNLEELVGFSESVNVQVLQAINLLTSKNSPQVRSLLKSINLFDIRDQLVFQILRYNLEPEKLTQVLGFTSFNQLCVQKQFKESHCMAFLMRKLLRYPNQDHFGLQMLIIKILKYDIAQSEENQKYVAKLLKNEQLIAFFYPNLLTKKQPRNFRCLSKATEEQVGQPPDEDDRKQRSPPHNEPQQDEEEQAPQPLQQMGPNSTIQDFLRVFYSPEYDDDRKQIQLQLDKVLIPVESDNLKINSKLISKKNNRIQKLSEQYQQDQLVTQTIINDWELKIQQKLQKCSEKTKSRLTRLAEIQATELEQGESSYFKICEIQQI